jgi:hypothetical protein
MFNALGQLVFEKALNKRSEIDLSHWERGLYFFSINQRGVIYSEKVLVN